MPCKKEIENSEKICRQSRYPGQKTCLAKKKLKTVKKYAKKGGRTNIVATVPPVEGEQGETPVIFLEDWSQATEVLRTPGADEGEVSARMQIEK